MLLSLDKEKSRQEQDAVYNQKIEQQRATIDLLEMNPEYRQHGTIEGQPLNTEGSLIDIWKNEESSNIFRDTPGQKLPAIPGEGPILAPLPNPTTIHDKPQTMQEFLNPTNPKTGKEALLAIPGVFEAGYFDDTKWDTPWEGTQEDKIVDDMTKEPKLFNDMSLKKIKDYLSKDHVDVSGTMNQAGIFAMTIDEIANIEDKPQKKMIELALFNQIDPFTGQRVGDMIPEQANMPDSVDTYIKIAHGIEEQQNIFEQEMDNYFLENYNYDQFIRLVVSDPQLVQYYNLEWIMEYFPKTPFGDEEEFQKQKGKPWSSKRIGQIARSIEKFKGTGREEPRHGTTVNVGILDPNRWK